MVEKRWCREGELVREWDLGLAVLRRRRRA
ncbi:hypothetical protein A2U01_0114051, partial [Trifolium medium]|nr:hypothetical protein [Trifolium medium]